MRQLSTMQQRGAAQHWLIGCGGALVLVLLVLGVGGYYVWTQVKDKVALGAFDVSAKPDPLITATPDEVLPPAAAGGFTREGLTVSPITEQQAGQTDPATTGGLLMANYRRGEETVNVMAVPTANAEAVRQKQGGAGGTMKGQHPTQPGQGVHMRVAFGPEPIDMAVWTNRNWTYFVQTTASQALEFAEKFEPVGTPGTVTPPQ